MKREVIKTADGSATIFLPDWNEHYHSKHGAKQEALHVFIKSGLHYFFEAFSLEKISILEIGFGSGLNTLITYFEAAKAGVAIDYCGIEAYPVSSEEIEALEYASLFSESEAEEIFSRIHATPWEDQLPIFAEFSLQKRKQFFSDLSEEDKYDLIYFDAFGPRVQPELWTEEIFSRMYKALKAPGVLVTYSAKGSVRRAMQSVGFTVERLVGPPGKREMLRATKS